MQFALPIWLLSLPLQFFTNIRYKRPVALICALLPALATFSAAIHAISTGETVTLYEVSSAFLGKIALNVTPLGGLFLLLINFISVIVVYYAGVFLKPARPALYNLHFSALLAVHGAMNFLCMLDNLPAFITAWEVMSLGSLVLILYDKEKASVIKNGLNYMIQMHIGVLFLTAAALTLYYYTGEASFSALGRYFADYQNYGLFLLFFIGFGFKAAFFPFHTWLRGSYDQAPPHVQALFSGATLKMALFGLMQVLLHVQSDLRAIGLTILGFSVVTALYGILQATLQKNIVRSLAYSSMENIGIIGVGIGLGVIGLSENNATMAYVSLTGALLQVVNHALEKSLLFFSTGAIVGQTETADMNQMGGVIKRAPQTALLFLCGALAISSIPPLGGFTSEFLIFNGLFLDIENTSLYLSMAGLLALLGLAITGGLSLFAFSRNFSIMFLGSPRSTLASTVEEPRLSLRAPMFIMFAALIGTGLFSEFIVPFIGKALAGWAPPTQTGVLEDLHKVEIASIVFLTIAGFILFMRSRMLSKAKVRTHVTWGCGYTAASPKIQYTASTYSDNIAALVSPIYQTQAPALRIDESDIFPENRTHDMERIDVMESARLRIPLHLGVNLLKKLSRLQSGRVQHYVLYGFIFILVLLTLTFLGWV